MDNKLREYERTNDPRLDRERLRCNLCPCHGETLLRHPVHTRHLEGWNMCPKIDVREVITGATGNIIHETLVAAWRITEEGYEGTVDKIVSPHTWSLAYVLDQKQLSKSK